MSDPEALFDTESSPQGRWAVISGCGSYRYSLHRTWDVSAGIVGWIMLNPSTADATLDDPTIRRCTQFARSWGYGGIVVRNLFAYRATDPRELLKVEDPVGPDNDQHLQEGAQHDGLTVCAWGAHGSLLNRDRHVRQLLGGRPLHHLGLTKAGSPRHPLYLRGDCEPTRWAS